MRHYATIAKNDQILIRILKESRIHKQQAMSRRRYVRFVVFAENAKKKKTKKKLKTKKPKNQKTKKL